ncbi:MAG: glutamate--tRNA ligase, partial [Saprospiraceae bacterium]|nr:glutamate--tRNA ligase [Saprospiraceae bacterium]
GSEEYIVESLTWFGLIPDEGPGFGGKYGPYRQSERKSIYKQYADKLIADGNAYYAFDTPDELEAMREGDQAFKYDSQSRLHLKNSLTLPAHEVTALLAAGRHVAVRLKIPIDETVGIEDNIRGHVSFSSNELDDKVIMKGDGMPTYHLANIVDDYLMKITHVIRGEEWLPSTAHHVLLYRFFGWTPPIFAHLPLILKPTGQGKLSKRDGSKFGFPVFPLSWDSRIIDDNFRGFREDGYLPEAVVNFLALLGWNPGTEQEIFDIEQLTEAFSIEKIVKSGARFDIDKARWFNQQYIIQADNLKLAYMIQDQAIESGYDVPVEYLAEVCRLMKERVHKADEIIMNARFFFEAPYVYEEETIKKKYKIENEEHLLAIAANIRNSESTDAPHIEQVIKGYIQDEALKMGDIMPVMRIAISGSMQGPDLIQTITLIGTKEAASRLEKGVKVFGELVGS